MKAPKGGWKQKLHSQHYLRVWFKDGQARTFYSLDWKHKYSIYNTELGLVRLRNLIVKYGSLADGAIIYSTTSKQTVEEYYEGILVQSHLNQTS